MEEHLQDVAPKILNDKDQDSFNAQLATKFTQNQVHNNIAK